VTIPRSAAMIDEMTRPFWTSGGGGVLSVLRCSECGYWIHPPAPRCRICRSNAVKSQQVSGRGSVYSFTVNHHAWRKYVTEPYVVAIVELDEQAGLRLTTNIIGCDTDDVYVGMQVVVDFLPQEDTWLPLFRPMTSA
jgi:uncharacterized OB-fold protein